jgi:hypothetical protein
VQQLRELLVRVVQFSFCRAAYDGELQCAFLRLLDMTPELFCTI